MKKIIISLILVLCVVFSCTLPAFAATSDEWTLGENATYIKNGDRILKPVEYYSADDIYKYSSNTIVQELDFVDYVTEQRYWGAYIEYVDSYWVPVVTCYVRTYADLYAPVTKILFVDEAYMETYEQIKAGHIAHFIIENGYTEDYEIGDFEYKKMMNSATISSTELDAKFVEGCSRYNVYAYDKYLSNFMYIVGEILLDADGQYYALLYNEHDSSYFKSDGEFNFQTSKEYKLHVIEDEPLKTKLDEMRQTVSGNNYYYWTLSRDALTIRNKDKVYKAVVYNSYELIEFTTSEVQTQYLGFADAETTSRYDGSYIEYTTDSVDSVLRVWLRSSGMWTTVIFVEEDYLSTFMQLKTDNANTYVVENSYDITMPITPSLYDLLDTGEMLVSPKGQLGFDQRFFRYKVYSVDASTDLMYAVGEVLHERDTQNYYFLKYSEYDATYFKEDGMFNIASYDEIRIYKIENSSIVESLNTLAEQRPDDDLGIIGGDNVSRTVTAIIGGIFFIGLPLAVLVFCVLMLIKSKKKMYHFPLVALACTSLIVAVVSVIVMIVASGAP